ncbi:hypothetical protein AB3331_04810 [Streptococcus sp. H49]|uniref:hypothetical protein n=1 Tax=Streptococcus huangxiaojuni TaxID=3237239 RepID=UPI0034A4BA3D
MKDTQNLTKAFDLLTEHEASAVIGGGSADDLKKYFEEPRGKRIGRLRRYYT